MDKHFWSDALKQFGIGTVFAVMLIYYYSQESVKWERSVADDQKRWESLFQQYTNDQRQSLETIRACCMDQRWSPK